ncbi:MAG: TIGR00282 family metallophosphoesterase [Fimbriiglobus sp.]
MRGLFLGDIVGAPGVQAVVERLPKLRTEWRLDFVFANAENATNGSGLMPRDYRKLRTAGVDGMTMGDHIYKKFEISSILDSATEPIVKPANFPPTASGKDHVTLTIQGKTLALISVMGRTYMRSVDCPFAAIDRVLAGLPDGCLIFVDLHAEATADKYQMLHYLAGRVTCLVGTHTHVPTADEHIRQGTAYITDLGMCGPHEGILGRRADRVLRTALTFEPSAFDVATDDVRLNGLLMDLDPTTRQATSVKRVCVG